MDSVRRTFRAAMRRLARDETVASAGRTALVLAPHPDDETLGCGAVILRKLAAGTAVTVAVLTDGRHSHRSAALSPNELAALRREEMAEAARRLGLKAEAVRWAGFVDGTLADRFDDLVRYVAGLLDELAPNEVYATSAAEPHPDHAALGRAARVAVSGRATVLLEYPVWLWGYWPLRRGDRFGSTVDALGRLLRRRIVRVRAGEYLAGKLNALEAHESQLRRPARVPADEEWAVLPAPVLAAARDSAELFLPWTAHPRT